MGAGSEGTSRNDRKNNFKTWIEPLEFDSLNDGVATIHVPTSFLGNYVRQNFGEVLLYQMNNVGADVRRIRFDVPATPAATTAPRTGSAGKKPAVTAAAKVAASRDDTLPAAPLDPRFTFDSFVVGKPNELAHAAAKRVAEGGPTTFNPLFLYGGVGLGQNPPDACHRA